MGWLILIVVAPIVFMIVAVYAVLHFAVLLVRLCFFPITVLLRGG